MDGMADYAAVPLSTTQAATKPHPEQARKGRIEGLPRSITEPIRGPNPLAPLMRREVEPANS